MYNPKSKRTSKQIGAVKKKTLDGLTANKNIDDIRALAKISNTQSSSIENIESDLSGIHSDITTINNTKQNKLTLTTDGSSGPSTLINSKLNIPDYSASLSGYVPYTGATGNVDLGEFQIKIGQVEFDQTPTGTAGVAKMRWNDQDGTVDLGLKGGNVTLQVGQEQVTRVVNKTGINLLEANYQAVRISGAQGNRLKVDLAQANNDANSAETLGIVTETINDNQEGFITTSGLVRGINTTGSIQSETWADGDMLYLSGTVAGQLTNIKPAAPIHTVIMGYVVRAHITQGQIYVKVDNGYELDELHNVSITTPLNDQVLQYESSTQLWKNKTLATGITIGSTSITSGTVGMVLFEGAGNVVQESPSIFWDIAGSKLNLGSIGVNGELVINRASTGGSVGGVKAEASGAGVHIGGGGYLDSIILTNGAGVRINTWAGSGSVSTERLRVTASTGNVLVNTTTDSGFKFDVNGTARVVNQLQVGSFTVGGGASSSIVTQGRISASGGITLYNPAAGDNQDTGIFPIGGVQIKHANSSVATFATVGGATSGTNVAINQGYNPGAGTGSVIGYSHSYSLYPSADNTVSYTSYYSRPSWNSSPFYNRITGPIRGFLFSNGLYNTQKLVDVVAFQSDGGRLLFTGDLPAASVTSGVSRGLYLNQTHTASANNDVLVGLDIAPTYTNGAFTGLANIDLRTKGTGLVIGSGVGYGALYGYNNDGIIQVVDGGTSAITGFSYATQLWLRPSGNAAGLNSNYWATIEQSTGGLYIQSGRYNSNLFLRTGRTGTSGNIYFNNAGGTMAMLFGATGNFAVATTTDSGFKFSVNGSILCTTVAEIQSTSGLRLRTTSAGASVQFAAANTNKAEIKTNDGSVLATTFNQSGVVGFSTQVSFGGTDISNVSAQVEINSITRGFLPPRMTNAQMLAIATPAEGLVVYDTTNRKLCCYDGATWQNLF